MSMAAQFQSYNAKQLDSSQRQQIAMKSLSSKRTVTELAEQNNVSRKFVHQQKSKALNAVNDAFEPAAEQPEKVLFYLPVTLTWLRQLILCLMLHCRANHRGIQKVLQDCFDHEMSLGTIHNISKDVKSKAKVLNAQQSLHQVSLAAVDEMFHQNKPVLTGIDIRSLYCFLLSNEQNRDFETWGSNFLDLQKQGLSPERFIETYEAALNEVQLKRNTIKKLSGSIDTLVSWMQHDVLNMPGLAPKLRSELYDFVLAEFQILAKQHPHRIKSVCTSLKNQKPFQLAFTKVLDEKFKAIAKYFMFPLKKQILEFQIMLQAGRLVCAQV